MRVVVAWLMIVLFVAFTALFVGLSVARVMDRPARVEVVE